MSSNNSHSSHILPLGTYITVGSILLVLTILTVYVASLDFGAYNLVIAMAIAAFKAGLVALIFMHLKYDSKLYSIIFLGALTFLALFIVITMFDTMRRDDIYDITGMPFKPEAVIYDKAEIIPVIESDSLVVDSTVVIDAPALIDSTSK